MLVDEASGGFNYFAQHVSSIKTGARDSRHPWTITFRLLRGTKQAVFFFLVFLHVVAVTLIAGIQNHNSTTFFYCKEG